MPTIYIDNKPYTVTGGENLLQACLGLGFDLPYFCWHPALHSVGACRQCAVKLFRDAHDTKGRITMSCMTPVRDGLRLSINDPEARAFREGVIGLLMANHPHDCPVCDEGGECHLQDMTVMTGHTYRAHRFLKRTHRNQYLGPFVNHEMNRCIACYRCVRFYKDVARGTDLDAFAMHDAVYFGRHEDGVLESEFSGNLVEICPTGVFTDKTFRRRYTRKWDLQTAPSICMLCGCGCNTIPAERYGILRRMQNRYNYDVNGYFLCDRGRFGYEFVNSKHRVRTARVRVAGATDATACTRAEALAAAGRMLAGTRRTIGIGSPRASLEANFALRTLVGPDRFCNGQSPRATALTNAAYDAMRNSPLPLASLREAAHADAIIILGEDLLNTAPLLALAIHQAMVPRNGDRVAALGIEPWDDAAVRRAVQDEHPPLFIATPAPTRLDREATAVFRAPPDDLARLALLTAHMLDAAFPAAEGTPDEIRAAGQMAAACAAAEQPLLIWGIGCRSEAIIAASAVLARALAGRGAAGRMAAVLPECNTLGVAMLGGMGLDKCHELLKHGEADTLIIMENDLFCRLDAHRAAALLSAARQVVVIDHLAHRTAEAATLVLPAATFAEATGTVVSSEGRAQRFFKVFAPEGDVQESWRWVRDLMAASGRNEGNAWRTFDHVAAAVAQSGEPFAALTALAPPADFRINGQKIARQSPRCSGRTAVNAARSVFDPPPPDDPDSPFTFSMEGSELLPPPPLIGRYWAAGWNSVQAVTGYQTVPGGQLCGGESGVRLIEPVASEAAALLPLLQVKPFVKRSGAWLAVPLYHLFGSEEMSRPTPGIEELSPLPYMALGPEEAVSLGLSEGATAEVTAGSIRFSVPCKLIEGLPPGIAGLPAGIEGAPLADLPQWVTIGKAAARNG